VVAADCPTNADPRGERTFLHSARESCTRHTYAHGSIRHITSAAHAPPGPSICHPRLLGVFASFNWFFFLGNVAATSPLNGATDHGAEAGD